MRTGILGGTFDPVHLGHLHIAEAAYREAALDRVLFMPSGNPPHKQHRVGASDEDRLAMLRLALRRRPHFHLSTEEMHPDGITYTYETMERLTAAHPGEEYYFLIGEDSLRDFHKWRCPERICATCTLLAAPRSAADPEAMRALKDLAAAYRETFRARIEVLNTSCFFASSGEIRKRVASGRNAGDLLPEAVEAYIRAHALYGTATE